MSLSNIRIILLNTTHPGNTGGVARAMKNMGLENLVLVSPCEFPADAATARAAGADDVLSRAQVCPTLDEALEGCQLVVGTSARPRTIAWPTLTPSAVRTSVRVVLSTDRKGGIAELGIAFAATTGEVGTPRI